PRTLHAPHVAGRRSASRRLSARLRSPRPSLRSVSTVAQGFASRNVTTPPPFALLDLDRRTGRLQKLLGLLGLLLRDLFQNRLGGAVHDVLRFLQSEARERADFLDHLDLL